LIYALWTFWHALCFLFSIKVVLIIHTKKITIMKKVLVALAMIMGLGTSVAFASVSGDTLAVEQTLQTPQDEFTQIAAKELPAVNKATE
jgi:hypothetical protein